MWEILIAPEQLVQSFQKHGLPSPECWYSVRRNNFRKILFGRLQILPGPLSPYVAQLNTSVRGCPELEYDVHLRLNFANAERGISFIGKRVQELEAEITTDDSPRQYLDCLDRISFITEQATLFQHPERLF